MPKSSISVSVDAYTSPVESAMVNNYIAENYAFPVSGVPVHEDSLKELLNQLKEIYDYKQYTFDISNSNRTTICECQDKFLLMASADSSTTYEVSIYGKTIAIANELFELTKPYQDYNVECDIQIDNYFLSDRGSLEATSVYKTIEDYKQISHSYYPYLDTDALFKSYLMSSESLLLLSADTGLGKSKIIDLLLKYLLLNIEDLDVKEDDSGRKFISVAYIKNTDILAKDVFWTKLQKAQYDLIILDDTDFMLISREHNDKTYSDDVRSKFISQFLSFTDGIDKNNTKFILTTNQKVEDIDTAILRKGRCFDILKFRELTNEEAKVIWEENKLSEELFAEYFGNQTTVKACEIGSKIELHRNMEKHSVETLRPYLKEDGISQYYTTKKEKTISF